MTSGRRPESHRPRFVLVVLAAITLIAISAMGVVALETEVISPRTFTLSTPDGGARLVADEAVSGQVIARVADAVTAEQLHERLQAQNATLKRHIPNTPLVVIGLPAGVSVNEGVDLLSAERVFETVEPDRLMHLLESRLIPDDPMYAEQWHWPLISAPMGWAIQTGSESTVVAVVDSGHDPDHEDLRDRYWVGPEGTAGYDFWAEEQELEKDFNDPDARPLPDEDYAPGQVSHGVHAAGLIGAATNNTVGVAGHDWACRLMILRVFGPAGSTATSIVLRGVQYAIDNGAHVINLSLGGGYTEVWNEVIANAYNAGIVVVAAAGNDDHVFTEDRETWWSPVCNNRPAPGIDNAVLGVAATDEGDRAAGFTNRDESGLNFVDVSAPGVDVLSTLYYDPTLPGLDRPYGRMSGTSMAAPIVAGLAALMRAQYPGFRAADIIRQIRATADDISRENPDIHETLGTGRINTAAALGIDIPPDPVSNLVARSTPNTEAESITITWRLSPQDRHLLQYRLMRAEETQPGSRRRGDFRLLATLEPGTSHYVDHDVEEGPPGEGPWYWYEVITVDESHEVPSGPVGPVEAEDDVPPPPVDTLVARDTPADDGGSISLRWAGYEAPDDLEHFNIYRDTREFTDVTEMEPHVTGLSSDTTQHVDTDEVVDGVEYWYAVTGVDDWENEETAVTAVGPVIANPNFAFSYPEGLSLMAVGARPSGPGPHPLADILGIVPEGPANLAYWDPELDGGSYVIWSDSPTASAFNHRLGRAWWLRSDRSLLVNISGETADPEGFEKSLVPGWNMVGNPFAARFDFSRTRVAGTGDGTLVDLQTSNERGFTRDYAWAYDTQTNSYRLISGTDLPFARREISRGRGVLMLARRPATLVLRREVAPAADEEDERLALDGWALRLVAEAEGIADTDNFLGVSENAAAFSGIVAPPRPDADLALYFVRPSADGARLATDFVEPGAETEWQIRVACAMPGATVRLSWPDLSELQNDIRPILVDNDTGRAIYLRTSTGYEYEVGEHPTERSFTLRLADGTDALAINTFSAGAADGGAEILYSLSAPAAVDIEVLNIAGITVRRIVEDRNQDAGSRRVLWDGRSRSGSPVPAGTYIVRITARSESGQRVSAIRTLRLGR